MSRLSRPGRCLTQWSLKKMKILLSWIENEKYFTNVQHTLIKSVKFLTFSYLFVYPCDWLSILPNTKSVPLQRHLFFVSYQPTVDWNTFLNSYSCSWDGQQCCVIQINTQMCVGHFFPFNIIIRRKWREFFFSATKPQLSKWWLEGTECPNTTW